MIVYDCNKAVGAEGVPNDYLMIVYVYVLIQVLYVCVYYNVCVLHVTATELSELFAQWFYAFSAFYAR
jgi:hypothetical protein